MEEKVAVTCYIVKQPCTGEGCSGKFVYQGNLGLAGKPPNYPHKCDICPEEATFDKPYPFILHE